MDKVTLGGDRLGSGNKMKQAMHDYERSNHNLSCSRVTSMAPGVLYPIYVNVGLTGDTFDINLDAFMRTLPTEGPMFGAFKLQLDVFTADNRLYQAILHNNTTEIGMDMNQVYLPKLEFKTNAKYEGNIQNKTKEQTATNSLLRYVGFAGAGTPVAQSVGQYGATITRKINALPILAYYDIFKNYYANKQEKYAYVIANGNYTQNITATSSITSTTENGIVTKIVDPAAPTMLGWEFHQQGGYVEILGNDLYINNQVNLDIYDDTGTQINILNDPNFAVTNRTSNRIVIESLAQNPQFLFVQTKTFSGNVFIQSKDVNLKPFELKNIDTMRKQLLTLWDLGQEYIIDQSEQMLPYHALIEVDNDMQSDHYLENKSVYPMQGLVVKCYQSDIFNNWLETSWVNKITQKSSVNTASGSFTMDALNLAKKIYNLYNRIAINGGSYDDWQQAVYGQDVYGKTEKPVYHGGLSAEVTFDEVVSTTAALQGDELQPLGTLGGRGTLSRGKGGNVIVKCREHCVVMIMASLTPRLTYSQGNAWYMNLDSVDDFHKPEFDQIGFQDMIGEHMAWWDTTINPLVNMQVSQNAYGKQPSWIHYQTDVDKVFGDFAQTDGKGFMVLQRMYEQDLQTGAIKDVTTYIDPSKYNYPFAVTDLTAQNFWGFFNFDIKSRRIMSAKQIPNV